MRLTTLDYAIIGLLMEVPRTGYAIRKVFDETAMGNYSSSPGSIYPAIKKLKAHRLISSSAQGKGELLSVEDEGKKALKAWLTEPVEAEDIAKRSDVLLLKFAFMDHLVSHDEKLAFMKSLVDLSSGYHQQLKAFHKEQGPDMPLHGRLAIEHGIAAVETLSKWAHSTYELFKHQSDTEK